MHSKTGALFFRFRIPPLAIVSNLTIVRFFFCVLAAETYFILADLRSEKNCHFELLPNDSGGLQGNRARNDLKFAC